VQPIVARLKEAFPHAVMLLRADCGFAVPRLYDFCEANGIAYTIAIPANAVFKRESDHLQQQALEQYEASGEKAKLYDHFPHQAETWEHHLRILAKAEAGAEGLNRRFVVSNRAGDPQRLFNFAQRGSSPSIPHATRPQLQPRPATSLDDALPNGSQPSQAHNPSASP